MNLEGVLKKLDYTLLKKEGDGRYHLKSDSGMLSQITIGVENYTNYVFQEHIGGCGVLNFAGNSYIRDEDIPKLKELFDFFRKNGVGAINCILGENYYNRENSTVESKLLELGFEIAAEYNNWQHGSNYKQRLYIIKLK